MQLTTPQVSPELASQLSDATLTPDVSPARQAALDAGVRAQISAEAARLHEGDDVLRREIEAALERENLDRERNMAGDADEHGDVKNSTALLGDLEEKASEAVASCYRANPTTSLNCWSEVAAFRGAVAKLEQQYVDSLR
ncbi:hypothetical protein H4582DRAFT_2167822 [Lactarius indigo]|nr:hypothetical protein H4582DRAFT_2167822 [Lactarius indigo]